MKDKINKLRIDLNHHNYLYYVLDKPIITDFEFDSLMSQLIDLEAKYPEFSDAWSPTQRVGGGLLKGFKSFKHNSPMLSLDNTYSKSDLNAFDKRVKKNLNKENIEYSCELKYDGVAISLIYKDGLLHKALTRGDGLSGDDVTENVKTIKSIPLRLFGSFPNLLEMRGEIFISKKEFETINNKRAQKHLLLTKNYKTQIEKKLTNEERIKIEKKYSSESKKLELYSNPRNFASGTLKLLDSSKVARRNLDCIFYLVIAEKLPFDNHIENLIESKKWGFKISEHLTKTDCVDDLFSFIKNIEFIRDNMPFEIDGVVIKVNNLSYQTLLGNTSKSPRWAISYKFKALQTSTILESIKYQVGRTGSITPVACLKPIFLAGSLIRRASLHNEDFVKKLDLKIGDTVFIEKGGDVIPKVVSVDLEKRSSFSKSILFVKKCPSCSSDLVRPLGEVNYYCLNTDFCLPQKINKVEHFISRDAMNINTLGIKTVELLFSNKIINNIADLYVLDINHFQSLKGFGFDSNSSKKAQNIIDGIQASKKQPFERVLYGLGIRYVGKTVAKKLTHQFKNLKYLMNASLDELLEVDEIGNKIATSLLDFFSKTKNSLILNRLVSYGLNFSVQIEDKKSNKLDGLRFVISGTFSHSRDDLKKIIESHGGKNVNAISKKTNYLIAGDNFGLKKQQLALSFNIPIISESDFFKMIK